MPEKVIEGWAVEAVEHLTWDILDRIRTFDEASLKNWIKEAFPDWKEIYE